MVRTPREGSGSSESMSASLAKAVRYQVEKLDENGVAYIGSPGSPLAVVFVHGWNGHTTRTWTWKPGWLETGVNRTLPELLAGEEDLDADYFCFGHSAGPLSTAGIEQVAQSLRTFLKDRLGDRKIALVSHSLGGLVCRRLILDCKQHEEELGRRIIGLLMFGTPNIGTEMVKAAQTGARVLAAVSSLKGAWIGSAIGQLVTRVLGKGAAAELRVFSTFLLRLNQEWLEFCATHARGEGQTLVCEAVGGERDQIVPFASAAGATPFGATYSLNKGHIALAKAKDSRDGTFVRTRKFIEGVLSLHADLELNEAIASMTNLVSSHGETAREDWLQEVVERVELSDPFMATGERVGDVPSFFNCLVQVDRVGLKLPRTIRIAASLSGEVELPDLVDYRFMIARGLLSERDHAKAAGFLGPDERNFRVQGIEGRVDGRVVPYKLAEIQRGADYTVLAYLAEADFDPNSRKSSLHLEIRGQVAVEHGWYCFYTGRLITRRLHVELTCPSKVAALRRNWSCESVLTESWGRDGRFKSAVTYEGPIFPEQYCYWVIGKERQHGNQEGCKEAK